MSKPISIFFCFDVTSTHVQHSEHTCIYLHSALICIARQGRTCAQVTACGMASWWHSCYICLTKDDTDRNDSRPPGALHHAELSPWTAHTCCSNQRHPAEAPSRKQCLVPHLHTMHHPHTSLDDCSLPSWIPECSGPARSKLWHSKWRTAGRSMILVRNLQQPNLPECWPMLQCEHCHQAWEQGRKERQSKLTMPRHCPHKKL